MKESVDSIITAIKPLADKIGEGAAHLYQVYVHQMVAEGIGGLITITAFVMFCVLLWIITKKSWNKYDQSNLSDDPVVAILLTIVAAIVSFFTLAAVLSITNSVTKVINPEYHAVQKILETVKGKEN